MGVPKGAIVVFAYSRDQLLDELLECINELQQGKKLPLILVKQDGFEAVDEVIKKWRNQINILIESDGSAETVAQNISRNRILGYSSAFISLDVDWVLAIEDDVILANDTLMLVEHLINKYLLDKDFRGINLGSRIPYSLENHNTYCKTRYGIYGQASVITKLSWKRMNKFGILKEALNGHWDAAMESFVKTGYMVAPNNSRYIDRGWDGTHMSSDPNDSYYQDLRASFVPKETKISEIYKEFDTGYWWRKDLRKFKSWQSFYYWIIFLLRHPRSISLYRAVFKNRSYKI